MSVLVYAVGGISIAVGALTAAHYLLSLTSRPAGHDRLRHWARISAAGKPHERRTAWNELGIRLGAVLTGTLLVLSVGDPAVGRVSLIAFQRDRPQPGSACRGQPSSTNPTQYRMPDDMARSSKS